MHDVLLFGHETTLPALAAAIFRIAGYPRVLQCIPEELTAVLAGRELEMNDIPKLRYLYMVVNEVWKHANKSILDDG